MATYVNDLRLKEIATGDEAGTWGTSTNTNLELIGEALGYGTQDCFASDADATTTVADGASDPARAMYFKVTSSATLTATRTLTIAPNTISRVMLIENATTGSQSITISQGSGSTVTIASGAVKMVYLDGAGAGGAVVEALADLELPTITVADLTATTADINGGTIDNTVIGGSTPAAVTTTALVATTADINAGTIDNTVIGGTTPAAVTTSSLVATTADINGGTIDGTVIGGSSAAAGTFTSLTATSANVNGTVTADGLTVDGAVAFNGGNVSLDNAFYLSWRNAANTLDITSITFDSNDQLVLDPNRYGVTFGLSSAPSLEVSGNGDISFYEDTGTTAKFFWDASAESLSLQGTGGLVIDNSAFNGAFSITNPSADLIQFTTGTNDDIAFVLSGSEKVRFDSSGNVGIGTTSPATAQIDFGSQAKGITINAGAATIALTDQDDPTNLITWLSQTNGITYLYNKSAGSMRFGTSDTERMRIDSSGNLLVGTTSTLESAAVCAYKSGSNGFAARITNNAFWNFVGINTSNVRTFLVYGDGDVENTNNSYGAISDSRFKSNIVDASSQIEDVMAMKVRRYTLDSTGATHIGVIAQELEESGMSGLVKENLDGTKAVRYSVLYMKAVKALQEAIARIETLEAEVAALKGAN